MVIIQLRRILTLLLTIYATVVFCGINVEAMAVEVGLTLLEINGAEAEFSDELSDPSSQDFKNLEQDVCEPV